MNFRLETMVNTYNVRSKAYLYHKWDSLEIVLFNRTTTNIQQQLEGINNDK